MGSLFRLSFVVVSAVSAGSFVGCGGQTDTPATGEPAGPTGAGGSGGSVTAGAGGVASAGRAGAGGDPLQGAGGHGIAGTQAAGGSAAGGPTGLGGNGIGGASQGGHTGTGGSGIAGSTAAGGHPDAGGMAGMAGHPDAGGMAGHPGTGGMVGVGGMVGIGGMAANGGTTGIGGEAGGGPPDGTGRNIQAMRRMYLGDTDWNGASDDNAWQLFGYNIDGLTFTSASQQAQHCKPQMNATAADIVPDGKGGVDNGFGKTIMPVLAGFANDLSKTESDAIEGGGFSMVLTIDKLGDKQNYQGLHAQIFSSRGSDAQGTAMGTPVPPGDVAWLDGSYRWHPYPQFLVDPSVVDPLLYASNDQFSMAMLVNGTFVSGSKGEVQLSLLLSGTVITLQIHGGFLTLPLSADRTSGEKGIIAGVLDTEEFAANIKLVAANISTSFCSGSTVDGILNTIRGASDIGKDGLQHPANVCDGISIGVGFDTQNASLGEPAAPTTPSDPCGSGTGGSG